MLNKDSTFNIRAIEIRTWKVLNSINTNESDLFLLKKDLSFKKNILLSNFLNYVNVKHYSVTISRLEKLICKLKNKIVEIENKSAELLFRDSVSKIHSVFKPLNTFCIIHFLCKQYSVKFIKNDMVGNKQRLEECIINNYNVGTLINRFVLLIFDYKNSMYRINTQFLSITIDKSNEASYSLGKNNQNISDINKELSNQFTFNNQLVDNIYCLKRNIKNFKDFGEINDLADTLKPYLLIDKISGF